VEDHCAAIVRRRTFRIPDSESAPHQTTPPHRLSLKRVPAYPIFDQRICSCKMSRQAKTVSMVLALTLGLAAPARSYDRQFMMDNADPADRPSLAAVLDNDWIEKLPYVTDLQPGTKECRDKSNKVTSVETNIVVMTDTEDHRALLEKQVPGSLEGFPVIVVVDRTSQYRLEGVKMMAKVQPVIDDPANKWILKIPHVTRMLPSTEATQFGEPTTAVIGIAVDNEKSIKEVQGEVPKTIGGFPTKFGWVDNGSDCFTNTGKGCDRDDDVNNGG
jgi:hypothetical protein